MRLKFVFCCLALLLLAGSAVADPVAVGTLDFQTVIPGDGDVGVNAFFTLNLTGNGVDFLETPATFTDGLLSLSPTAGLPIQYVITSLTSGSTFPSDLFPETTVFTSASFTGVLEGLNWSLSALLLPVGDSTVLTAGQFAVIYAYAENGNQEPQVPASSVPEPATLALLGSGLTSVAMRRLRRRA